MLFIYKINVHSKIKNTCRHTVDTVDKLWTKYAKLSTLVFFTVDKL